MSPVAFAQPVDESLLDLDPGGKTIAGPGQDDLAPGESVTVINAQSLNACLTVSNAGPGSVTAVFISPFPPPEGPPSAAVPAGKTRALCAGTFSPSVQLTCDSGPPCTFSWRADALS